MRRIALAAFVTLLASCGGGAGDATCSPDTDFACAFQQPFAGGSGPEGGSGGSGGTGGIGPGGSGGTGGSGGVIVGDDKRCIPGVGTGRRDAVCARWKCTLETAKEGAWIGHDFDQCAPGDCPDGRRDGLLTTNTYRYLAGLDFVTIDDEKSRLDQACAVIMDRNHTLTHTPPQDFACWTQDGYDGASHSNIATAPSVYAVHLYMFDGGANNQGTLGHRRWILAPSLDTIGIGSTDNYSCMYVLHSAADDGHPYVPWPPAGPVPVEAITGLRGTGSLDSIGWSIQSNSIRLSASSEVTVTEDGIAKAVRVFSLGGGYGSAFAIQFKPDGWTTRAGSRYRVRVTGTEIDYTVEPVNCP